MVRLLENGNVSALVDSWHDTLVATGTQQFTPDDPDYERLIPWLPIDDRPRARALFDAAHQEKAAI